MKTVLEMRFPIWGVLCVLGGFLYHLALGYFYTVGMLLGTVLPLKFREHDPIRCVVHGNQVK